MKGKEKCKALREIRRKIAENNDIEYITKECEFQGECKGTCPKCEAELAYLEKEVERRRKLGKAVVVTGISMGAFVPLAGCTLDEPVNPIQSVKEFFGIGSSQIDGDVPNYNPDDNSGNELMGDYDFADPSELPEPEIEGDEIYIPVDNESGEENNDSCDGEDCETQNAGCDDGECDGQNVGDGEEESEEIEIMGDFIDE